VKDRQPTNFTIILPKKTPIVSLATLEFYQHFLQKYVPKLHQFLILTFFSLYSCVHIKGVCKMIFLSFISSILRFHILCLCGILF
jgi:hypothetical protein